MTRVHYQLPVDRLDCQVAWLELRPDVNGNPESRLADVASRSTRRRRGSLQAAAGVATGDLLEGSGIGRRRIGSAEGAKSRIAADGANPVVGRC